MGTKHVIYQKLVNLCSRRLSVLTSLTKMSSLVCKSVFYRPEHNANEKLKDLKCKNWNIPTDRAQRADKKNEFICLVIILTFRVLVINLLMSGGNKMVTLT